LHISLARMCSEAKLEVRWHRWALGRSLAERLTDYSPDVDDKSIKFAKNNITLNSLQDRIKPVQTKPDGPLIPLDLLGFEKYAQSMTNNTPANGPLVLILACAIHHSMIQHRICWLQRRQ